MQAKRDLFIVIFLLVALGVAWYYTGGTANDLARSGPFFTLPQQGVGIPAYVVPSVEYTPPPNPDAGGQQVITNFFGTVTEEVSPYAQFVSLESGSASSVDGEYVIIRVASNARQKVTMTGWRVESTATGFGATLPQASILPAHGSVNSIGPVSLGGGQTAYVVTGRSPIGSSFRTNLCTGYLEQYQNFSPALRLECPGPQEEATRALQTGTYTDACYNTVRTLSRCTLTTASIPIEAGAACQTFIQETLTYNGCVNAHKNTPNFYKDDWYLYLNRDQELWRSRSERIRLVDESGKVVDSVSY